MMRLLGLISIWVWGLSQGLSAQNIAPTTASDLQYELATYVEAHLNEPAPNEIPSIENLQQDYQAEGVLTRPHEEIQKEVRSAYWGKNFGKRTAIAF
ncbi:MAG: hypothetical protein AAFP19_00400 [Bacteroidota bacterium]